MRLGKASLYAIFATIYIARHDAKGPVQARAIAKAYDIPEESLKKVLKQLVQQKIIISERGRCGGFRRSEATAGLTLLEIVEAIEGRFDREWSVPQDIRGALGAKQIIEQVYGEVAKHTQSELRRRTVQDLIDANGFDLDHVNPSL